MPPPDQPAPSPAGRDLTGLVAVVTGGNRGIGLALALGLADAGAAVAVWGRNTQANDDAVAALSDVGAEALAVACDVSDEAQVVAAMARTTSELGPLGCMVVNAGVAPSPTPLVDTGFDAWRQVVDINLHGSFLCAREAARRFVADGDGGSMIVVSSTISRYGAAGHASYAATKTGLVGLGRTLAVELARHRVRCNILIPGWTATTLNEELRRNGRFVEVTTARTPVRRWAEASEFRAVAAFLADPRLTFHTGNEVVIDGGYTIF